MSYDGVEGPDGVDRVPGDAKPARQRGLDVRLAVRVLRDPQPQAPVERERPGHVRHDKSENVQSSGHAVTLCGVRRSVLDESDIARLWDHGCVAGRPRWDDDTTLVGVGSAAPLLPLVEAFVDTARDDGWVAEEPVRHLRPALDAWLAAAPDGPWQDVALSTDGTWLVIDAAWRGEAGSASLRADAYALLGSLAKLDTFVTQRVQPENGAVVFELATGLPDGRFAPHGHLVRLVVGGPVARRVADERRAIGDTAR